MTQTIPVKLDADRYLKNPGVYYVNANNDRDFLRHMRDSKVSDPANRIKRNIIIKKNQEFAESA